MGTIQELCEGPDLYYYIKKYKTIPEKEAKIILKQIISGIKYLHD
jgi:tousled-like kinase